MLPLQCIDPEMPSNSFILEEFRIFLSSQDGLSLDALQLPSSINLVKDIRKYQSYDIKKVHSTDETF